MKKPIVPVNESKRLIELYGSGLLDSEKEKDFDSITDLTASIFNAPVAIISLVDETRQWFKSCFGLPEEITETSREVSFCAHAINNPSNVFIVPDARLDHRFFDNPLVVDSPNIVFYAGAPLISKKGYSLGTLCLIDFEPRKLNEQEIEILGTLSRQVSKLIDLRLTNRELTKTLEEKNLLLKEIHHRVKNNLQLVSSLLSLQANANNNDNFSNAIKSSQDRIKTMAIVHEKLYQSKSLSNININSYLKELITAKSKETLDKSITINLDIPDIEFKLDKLIPIGLLINEMITNSIKHAFDSTSNNKIEIRFEAQVHNMCTLKYMDNGSGFKEGYKSINQNSIGMDLIDSFTAQLDGNLEIVSTNEGVAYTISFQK